MALANLYIEYTTNSGVTWDPVVSGYGINAGSGIYEWIIPSETTNEAMIRITDIYTDTLLVVSNPFSMQKYDSVSELIINKVESTKLEFLKSWALATSWCSRAILEVFENKDLMDLTQELSNELVIDEYDRLTIPENALSNTTYQYYSKIIEFIPDEASEVINRNVLSTKWSMQISEEHTGLSRVKMEFNTKPGGAGDWFVCYDTGSTNPIMGPGYPNGYIDYSREEIDAYDLDPFGNEIVPTNKVQIRISITTDSQTNGGYINYYALLANPSLAV